MKMNEFTDGIMDGAAIAEEMFKDIPACLRVRMGCDAIFSSITSEERKEIEDVLRAYLDEAALIERDFDWDAVE